MLWTLNFQHPPPHNHHHHHHRRIHHSSASSTVTKLKPNKPSLILFHFHKPQPLHLKLSATTPHHHNPTSLSPAGDILRRIAFSSLALFLGLGFCAFSLSSAALASTTNTPPLTEQQQQEEQTQENDEDHDVENGTDEAWRAAFEKWKSKTYALTVPLRVVALRNSVPAVWFKEFLGSQGKRAKLRVEFRRSLLDIFHELSLPFTSGNVSPKSALAADIVSLGDSWLGFAISKGLVVPMQGVEEEAWFEQLSDKWKVYLRRSSNGKLDSQGKIWAAPYRWGSMVIAYKKSEFRKRKLAPIEDWEDLWRPELAGKISMVDSPREVIGAVLKCMGTSYNTENIDLTVAGGRDAVQQKLALLVKQVRLFDSLHYLKSLGVGDVWVAVGWSADVIPAAKRMSNIAVIVPKSGASLWADFWAIPDVSTLATDRIGGRSRGPSPLVYQWIEFCLQANRALQFRDEAIPGASPIALKSPSEESEEVKMGMRKLDTNLIAGVPPAEILARCEFLEPLSDAAMSDYEWLIRSIPKPSNDIIRRVYHYIASSVQTFRSKMQSKMV